MPWEREIILYYLTEMLGASRPAGDSNLRQHLDLWGRWRPITEAINTIEGVHGFGNFDKIIRVFRGRCSNGNEVYSEYCCDPETGLGHSVAVHPDSRRPTFACIHELAHFGDQFALGAAGHFASPNDAALSAWRKAVDGTKAVTDLKKTLDDYTFIDDNGDVLPVLADEREYVNYLLRRQELFARSYTQYIIGKSRKRTVKAMLEQIRVSAENTIYPEVWDYDDFEAVARALDILFRQKGWIE